MKRIGTIPDLYAAAHFIAKSSTSQQYVDTFRDLETCSDERARDLIRLLGVTSREEAEEYLNMMMITYVASTSWISQGCQLFSLDERTMDLAVATFPVSLKEFHMGNDPEESKDEWRLPYETFAIEFPFLVAVDMHNSEVKARRLIVEPFRNVHDEFAWNVLWTDVTNDMSVSVVTEGTVLYSLITNLCFFLNETGTITRTRPSYGFTGRAKSAARAVKAWSASFHQVTNLPLGIAKEFLASGKPPGEQFRMGKRIMVRGHWRLQPCGPGRQFRKHKWIAPYMKGDEDDPLWTRTYKVTPGKLEL